MRRCVAQQEQGEEEVGGEDLDMDLRRWTGRFLTRLQVGVDGCTDVYT